MRKFLLILVLLYATLATAHPAPPALQAGRANIQPNDPAPDAKSAAAPDLALPSTPAVEILQDAATRKSYLDSMQRYYQYREDGYAYRSRVFEWQLFSSRIIFAVVILLVLAGLVFAAVQFYVAMTAATQYRRRARATTSADAEAPEASRLALESELEITGSGVTVKSSVLGVVILALSLAFFYLYLVYVYPIHEVI